MFRSARFVEEETPPADATVVDQTWRYVNRNGGPDRRFNNNRELPICLYGKIDLRASKGVNQRIQCSRVEAAERFVASLTASLLESAIPISASHGAAMRTADRASDRKRPQAGRVAESMLLATS